MKPRFCIIGLKCYDLLTGVSPPRYIGGIESQLSLLGPALARRGLGVSMIVYDHGQPDGQLCNGVRTFGAFSRETGVPAVRFLHPRWTGLCGALARADADVYYQTGAGCETGQVAWWCRRHGRRFVYNIASDGDCSPALPALHHRRERVLFRYGLRAADVRLTQTERQQQLLLDAFGLEAMHVPGYCASPAADESAPPRPGTRRLLWVGRLAPVKRPELLIELARRMPGFRFEVFGDANADGKFAGRFKAEAAAVPGITLHGRHSPSELAPFYASADLLVNTSQVEGFPVTFLEAFSHGLPVATIFDPDGAIHRHGLGVVGSDPAVLAGKIQSLCDCPSRWAECGRAGRQYFQARHSVDAAAANFERVAEIAMSGGRQGSGVS